MRAKLERSRQSARECRARKKLRYQYLEELVADREKAVLVLRHELDMYQQYFKEMDEGNIPEAVLQILEREQEEREQQIAQQEWCYEASSCQAGVTVLVDLSEFQQHRACVSRQLSFSPVLSLGTCY